MNSWLVNKLAGSSETQDIKTPKVRERAGKLGGVIGIVCNLVLFVSKLVVGLLANSVSITADAFNNLSDMGSSVITILGFKLSSAPPDKDHPFGHGRIEYMSGAIVSVLIFLVGFELLRGSVQKLIHPEELAVSAVTFVVLILSIIIKLWLATVNFRLGKRLDASALRATALDSLCDCVATTAVLIAAAVSLFTGINIDPYVGILVSAFIMFSGFRSLKETINPLLGMPPEPEMVENVQNIVLSFEGFLGIHDLIIHNYGPGRVYASLHVEVPATVDIVKCHDEIDSCEKLLKQNLRIEAVIHIDPVDCNDSRVLQTKSLITEKILRIDKRLSIHDFRVIWGEEQTNLVFDVVVPHNFSLTQSELTAKIEELAREIDKTFVCVITFDNDFTPSK